MRSAIDSVDETESDDDGRTATETAGDNWEIEDAVGTSQACPEQDNQTRTSTKQEHSRSSVVPQFEDGLTIDE